MIKSAQFIKHKEDFLFRISKDGNVSSINKPFISSNKKDNSIYFTGICYNYSATELSIGFDEIGPEFVRNVKGSYLIFLVSKGRLYILTDKTHSKKAYFLNTGSEWIISNNFDLLPQADCSLNRKAIACYLANGAMLNGLTLFNEVQTTRPATIHSLSNSEINFDAYWSLTFDYNSIKSNEFYQSQMEKLIIDSVAETYKTVGDHTFLSLSGGYDARSILGILSKFIAAQNIHCFSYGAKGFNNPEGDILVSKELAQIAGYSHKALSNYNGNYIEYISRNANLGNGMSFFCDELNAWDKIALYGSTDVFVGDEFFGHKDFPLNSNQEILDLVQVNGANSIKPLKNVLPKNIFTIFSKSIQDLNEELMQKTSSFESSHDKKDYLFFHINLSDIILPVREIVGSIVGYVHNPFLYDDLLEFVLTLPPSLRTGKNLFRKSAQNIMPEFFSNHVVTAWGDETNHCDEIIKNKKALVARIEITESELDTIISKTTLVQLIDGLKKPSIFTKVFKFIYRVVQYFRRHYSFLNNLLEKLNIHRIPIDGFVGKKETLILRLLLLREYLRND